MWQTNLFSAVGLFFLGLIIRKYRLSFLIAGYNTASQREKDVYDEDMLVRTVSSFLMVSAGLLMLGGIASMLFVRHAELIIISSWIIFTVHTVVWLVYANTSGRLLKQQTH